MYDVNRGEEDENMYDQSTRSAFKKVDETFLTAEKIYLKPKPFDKFKFVL